MQPSHQANQLKNIVIIIRNILKLAIRTNKEEKKVVKIEKTQLIKLVKYLKSVEIKSQILIISYTLSQILANIKEIKKELRKSQKIKIKI